MGKCVISQIQQRFSLFQFVGNTTTDSDAWLFLLLYVFVAILAAVAFLSLLYLANMICGCCPVRSRSAVINANSEFYTEFDDWEAGETSTLSADHPFPPIYTGAAEQRLDVNDPPPIYQRLDETLPIYEELECHGVHAEVGEQEHIYVNTQNGVTGETGEAVDAEEAWERFIDNEDAYIELDGAVAADQRLECHGVHAEVGEQEHIHVNTGETGEAADAEEEEAWLFMDNEDGYIEIRDHLLDESGVEVVSQERDLPIETNFPINRQRKPVTSSRARARDTPHRPGVEVVSQERDLPIETNLPINRQRKPVTSDTPRRESSGARARDHRPKRPDSPYPGQRSRPLARVRANMVRREDCQHPPPFPLHLRQTEPGYAIIVTVKETNV